VRRSWSKQIIEHEREQAAKAAAEASKPEESS
jgi:hypothetical protein